MKEIGGYFEFETYNGRMLHEDGILLNCGRSCLVYLIRARGIKTIYIPYFMCDVMFEVCKKNDVEVKYYRIGTDFLPLPINIQSDEWLYLMNYYGQITTEKIMELGEKYNRVIVDFAQDYFREPIKGLDTIYTCRKFFGVTDGAILYTDAKKLDGFEIDESFERLRFIAGRYERTASEFYQNAVENNAYYDNEPIKYMSKLTRNILRSLDYKSIKDRRTENYIYLHERFKKINRLDVRIVEGAFAYPLFIKDGSNIRKKLAERRIYVPVLWPNVLSLPSGFLEFEFAKNILPLPCDHRYSKEDMDEVVKFINGLINGK